MKRKFVLIVLALVLAFGAVSVVSAKVTSATINTNRLSNTSANITASASFNGTKDSCLCKLTLQEKYNNSWRTARNVPVKIVSRTKNNASSITLMYKFTLLKGKVYRIKAYFKDTKGSTTTTSTYYSSSF